MSDDPTPPTLRQIGAAALSAVTGDYTDACHVDARPTLPPPPPTSDDVCPGCGADTCVCDHPALLETLP